MITPAEAREIAKGNKLEVHKYHKASLRINEFIFNAAREGLYEVTLEGDDLKGLHNKELNYVQSQLMEAGFDVDLFPPHRENGNVWEMVIYWGKES